MQTESIVATHVVVLDLDGPPMFAVASLLSLPPSGATNVAGDSAVLCDLLAKPSVSSLAAGRMLTCPSGLGLEPKAGQTQRLRMVASGPRYRVIVFVIEVYCGWWALHPSGRSV